MIKETGIIMSGNHPKLILDGIKTMTRRTQGLNEINLEPHAWRLISFNDGLATFNNHHAMTSLSIKCPYGGIGDRLWVRETHKYFNSYMLGDHREDVQIVEFKDGVCRDISEKLDPDWWETRKLGKWRSARFLHKWASRITLEITEVRVERVQEISALDCEAEGIDVDYSNRFTTIAQDVESSYKLLWDSLNAKRGYGWEVNPWVWVISFNLVNISTTNV